MGVCNFYAVVAQLVEHLHGKEKVTGSIPVNGSIELSSIPRINNESFRVGRGIELSSLPS